MAVRSNRPQPVAPKYCVKIATVGDPAVGKSCLIHRFFQDVFPLLPIFALGPSATTKVLTMRDVPVKLEVWDTPIPKFGVPSFTHYQQAQIVVLCFACDNEQSFLSLPRWIHEVESYAPHAFRAVVCTKIDTSPRHISRDRAGAFANSVRAKYFEVSAKSGVGVDGLFDEIVMSILAPYMAQKPEQGQDPVPGYSPQGLQQRPSSGAPGFGSDKQSSPLVASRGAIPQGIALSTPLQVALDPQDPLRRVPELTGNPWAHFWPWPLYSTDQPNPVPISTNEFSLQGFVRGYRQYSKAILDAHEYVLKSDHPDMATVFVNGIQLPKDAEKVIGHGDMVAILSPPEGRLNTMKIYEFKVIADDESSEYLKREPSTSIFAVQQKKISTTATVSGPAFLQLSSTKPVSQEVLYIAGILRKPITQKEQGFWMSLIRKMPDARTVAERPFYYDPSIIEERVKPLFSGWVNLLLHSQLEVSAPPDRRSACYGFGSSDGCKGAFGSFFNKVKSNCELCGEIFCVNCIRKREVPGMKTLQVCEPCYFVPYSGETSLKRRFMAIQKKYIFFRRTCSLMERPTLVLSIDDLTNRDNLMRPAFQNNQKLAKVLPGVTLYLFQTSSAVAIFNVKDGEVDSWRQALYSAIKTPLKPASLDLLNHCQTKNLEETRALIQVCDIDTINQHGTTALIRCGKVDGVECAGLLLQNGCSINAQDKHGRSALHWAALNGHSRIIGLLLQYGIDMAILDAEKKTALQLVPSSSVEAQQKMIDFEQEIWGTNDVEGLQSRIKQGLPTTFRNSEGITLMQQACERKSEGCLSLLIRGGQVDLDQRNIFGETALHACLSEVDWFQGVSLLLVAKANPNVADYHGFTPLHIAAMKNFDQSLKLLLENKADPFLKTNSQKATALHLAVLTNSQRTANILMKNETLWRETDLLQQTALTLGKRFKRDARILDGLQQKVITDQLFELCQHSDKFFEVKNVLAKIPLFNPDAANTEGDTVLHVATRCQNILCVKYLLELRCSPTARNHQRETPTDIAKRLGADKILGLFSQCICYNSLKHSISIGNDGEIKRLLSETPVDVNYTETDGSTVLHYAAKNKCSFQTLRLLLDAGATKTVMVKDEINKRNPLAEAAAGGNSDFIRELLSRLPNEQRLEIVNDQDIFRDTPLHLAVKNLGGNKLCLLTCKELLRNGARVDIQNTDGKTVAEVLDESKAVPELKDLFFISHFGAEILSAARAGDFSLLQDRLENILADEKRRNFLKEIVNIQDFTGKTALHYACQSEEGESCVTILLTYKANVDIQDDEGNTCEKIAKQRPNRDALIGILKFYQPIVNILGYAAGGNLERLKEVFTQHPELDVNFQKVFSFSAIQLAAWKGHSLCLQDLISRGANVSIRNADGETPVFAAARGGHIECIKILLKAGASLDVVNHQGETLKSVVGQNAMVARRYKKQLELLGITIPTHDPPKIQCKLIEKLMEESEIAEVLIRLIDTGSVEMLRSFVKQKSKGKDGLSPDSILNTLCFGQYPIHRAAARGEPEILAFLLQYGANISAVDSNGLTAEQLATTMAAKKAFAEYGPGMQIANICLRGDSVALEKILPEKIVQGFNINWRYFNESSLLFCVAVAGTKDSHVECAKILIRHNCNINLRNDSGCTALHLAAQLGRSSILKLLIKAGTDPNDVDSKQRTLDAKEDNNLSALTLAAMSRRLDCVRILIDEGANTNVTDSRNKTPLMYTAEAAGWGSFNDQKQWTRVCKILIQHPTTRLNIQDSEMERTALHYITMSGRTKIMKAFLSNLAIREQESKDKSKLWTTESAVVNIKDKLGNTALAIAAQRGDADQIKLLKQAGASLDLGRIPPLWLAIVEGHTDTVKLLLSLGADPNLVCEGLTPLLVAMTVRKGEPEPDNSSIVKLLLNAGADTRQEGKITFDEQEADSQGEEAANARLQSTDPVIQNLFPVNEGVFSIDNSLDRALLKASPRGLIQFKLSFKGLVCHCRAPKFPLFDIQFSLSSNQRGAEKLVTDLTCFNGKPLHLSFHIPSKSSQRNQGHVLNQVKPTCTVNLYCPASAALWIPEKYQHLSKPMAKPYELRDLLELNVSLSEHSSSTPTDLNQATLPICPSCGHRFSDEEIGKVVIKPTPLDLGEVKISPLWLAQAQQYPHDTMILRHDLAMELRGAIQRAEVKRISVLLKENSRFDLINYQSEQGRPLDWALKREDPRTMREVLQHNPSKVIVSQVVENLKKNPKASPEMLAVFDEYERSTQLYAAVKARNMEQVLTILRNPKVDVNFTFEWGNTPLHAAATNTSDDILELLLSHSGEEQPNPFKANSKELTVFDIAFSKYGESSQSNNCVEILLRWVENSPPSKAQKKTIHSSLERAKAPSRVALVSMWNDRFFEDNPVKVESVEMMEVRYEYYIEKKEKKDKEKKEKDKKSDNEGSGLASGGVNITVQSGPQTPQTQRTYQEEKEKKQAKKNKRLRMQILNVQSKIKFAELEEKIKESMNTGRWYRLFYTYAEEVDHENHEPTIRKPDTKEVLMPIMNDDQLQRAVCEAKEKKIHADQALRSEAKKNKHEPKVKPLVLKVKLTPAEDNTRLGTTSTLRNPQVGKESDRRDNKLLNHKEIVAQVFRLVQAEKNSHKEVKNKEKVVKTAEKDVQELTTLDEVRKTANRTQKEARLASRRRAFD